MGKEDEKKEKKDENKVINPIRHVDLASCPILEYQAFQNQSERFRLFPSLSHFLTTETTGSPWSHREHKDPLLLEKWLIAHRRVETNWRTQAEEKEKMDSDPLYKTQVTEEGRAALPVINLPSHKPEPDNE